MANYLTIDIGNSSAKAALWDEDKLAAEPIWGNLSASDIERLCSIAGQRPRMAAVCAVAVDRQGLVDAATSLSDAFIDVNSSTPTPLDLSRYATKATLGADRIAAMAGAMAMLPRQELLVIDCGTAITYDRVSAEGEFLGGNIAPGLGMRLRALHAFTARLPEVETNISAPLWGQSTIEAMQAGALHGILAEAEYYHRQAPDAQVVLTGGRAKDLNLPFPTIVNPDLVLRGLKNIIDYNESK